MDVILRAEGVDLFYGTQQAVFGADFTLKRGEVAAIMGSSGSGKSSLLYCLAGVLPPSNGTVTFDGERLSSLPDGELSALRRTRLGFVFQYGELLPELTVEENAALPLRLAGISKSHAHAMAGQVLGGSGWATYYGAGRQSCQVARVSVWQLHGLWSTGRTWCSPTSRPGRSTAPTRPLYWTNFFGWQEGRRRP
ncbi:Vitamin B12 import ATP-binding protein BtuD [Streptomyces tanashiensis]